MNLRRRGAAYLLVSLLAACSSNSSGPTTQTSPGAQPDIRNVIYVGSASDEALPRLLAVTPKNDPRQAVILDSPDQTAPLALDSAVTFEFHSASQALRAPGPHLEPTATPSFKWRRSFHELLQWLTPERTAYAHLPPYNGWAYYLVVSDKDGKQILQVFTPDTSFSPEQTDSDNLKSAPQPLTLTITSAFFDEGSIPTDGGPFVGGTFSFRFE
jgi:hypothetical protein